MHPQFSSKLSKKGPDNTFDVCRHYQLYLKQTALMKFELMCNHIGM